jgi:AraC family transcriptional regulator
MISRHVLPPIPAMPHIPYPTITVEAELSGRDIAAQIVRFDIPSPTDNLVKPDDCYQVNMCLTPRPLHARACYEARWGPHRFERLGDIFLVPPGEVLRFRGDRGQQSSLTCQLRPSLLGALVGRDLLWDDHQLAATLDITNARIRALLFRLTGEVRYPGFASDRMLKLFGQELAIEIARYCLEVNERPVTGGLASWRLRLIDERLSDDGQGGGGASPTLAELAAICNVSIRQLTRGFRISRACSLGDYIEQRRMEAAKRLLATGESVKGVAFAMGFASPSSFTFAFRRAIGVSPSQFRQRQLPASPVPA